MTDAPAPAKRRVQLKRVTALKAGDVIEPARGVFTKTGDRLRDLAFPHSGPWFVVASELDSSGLWVIDLKRADNFTTVLWAPTDGYVVLS